MEQKTNDKEQQERMEDMEESEVGEIKTRRSAQILLAGGNETAFAAIYPPRDSGGGGIAEANDDH
jgi:hypothetical protein